MDMHQMLMPDRDKVRQGNYPSEWVHSVFTESCFKDLYKNFDKIWKSLGKDSKSDPPKVPSVPQVAPANVGSFTNYAEVAVQLRRSYTELNGNVTELVKSVRESGKWSEAGQEATNKIIDEQIVAMAPTAPPQGIQIDSYILTWVTEANNSLASEIETVKQGQSGVAKDIDDQTKMIKELQDHIKKLEQAQKHPDLDPPSIDTGKWPTGLGDPRSTDNTLPPGLDGLDGLDDPDNSGLTPPGLNDPGLDTPGVDNGLNPQTPGGIDPIGSTPGVTTPPTPAVPPASAMSPMGSGMDMMSSMLPMMMQQAMMRNMADRDLNDRRAELDPSRFDDRLDAVAPPPVAPPVTAQPAVAQPSTTAPATHHPATPAGTTSSTQPTVAPGRTPDADGSVTYTFPDGRTQKVSAMVAQALDAAFGNRSGTDAQKAYEKTSAKWSDKKQIGTSVDPFQLMTGDVAVWEKRTAILVVFPSDDGAGTLEAVIDGELKPCNPPEMSDKAGEFGSFTGFVHPKGIEVTAPTDGSVPPSTPGSADQPAAAAMPVVATG
ncbi:hypothetical protein ACWEKR_20615 [Nocardia sp. NPDC004573]